MINSKYNCVFIHIPRTAGSSIEYLLGAGIETIKDGYTLGSFESKNWTIQEHLDRFPECKKMFRFTFVRNPWDRMLSTYKWLCFAECHPFHLKEVSFAYWIRSVCPKTMGNSCFPQTHWLDNRIDFVGRFERLNSDWYKICQRIGMENFELPWINNMQTNNYQDYYDNETRNIVAKLYASDIEAFGYEF